ncbi:2Fe-2S iron-sulfur cluster-binding protein [Temperatibacter marinus]|uniref:Succinate dehydrogenase iron-sulfur subunit n=1 Tax=Temperatibacter marinus TaxID=1456591 RepID=A0AA52EI53_9PROT|nr:2Fe-2S iron-sulfur cluster-binding protein [Temperatibacter marinus]WND02967.1 2Fe-2S iron-sulfur cluster-binding protein [Temperatibacter marinus]
MKFTITRIDPNKDSLDYEVDFSPLSPDTKPTALDVLLQVQENIFPDLAYRYGCRNALCGVCTIEVNGKPKLACKHKLRENDHITSFSSLPTIRDFVVRRDLVNKQLQGHLEKDQDNGIVSSDPAAVEKFDSLNQCIECYACLDGCPLHEKNEEGGHTEALPYGNPYAFLKAQQAIVDPQATSKSKEKALSFATDLGLNTCIDCDGCKCGVGINLMREVINPLLDAKSAQEK